LGAVSQSSRRPQKIAPFWPEAKTTDRSNIRWFIGQTLDGLKEIR
jgi:hypothetical protein